ncbi:hypothetical protein [Runella zeae]|uniref:hypothetical protein n=1 Tax=Runella zeae TaxID=94255 RepID=UPI00040F3E4B|nr:hypothetical protein [Runella zeae]
MNRVMNLPPQAPDIRSAFHKKWFWLWVSLPIGAYYVSWLLMMMPFPLFLVIGQWLALQSSPKKQKPMTSWLLNLGTLLITGLIITLMVDKMWTNNYDDYLIFFLFGTYYLVQCFNEWIFFQLFPSWRFGYWSAANLIAAVVWIVVLMGGKHALPFTVKQEYVLWFIIPLLGIISNVITGLGIHLATQTRYGL